VAPLIERMGRFADLIETESDCGTFASLRSAEGAGRPLGSADFVANLERLVGRRLHRRRPGASRKSGSTNWN
jgi:putative transposase